MAREELELDAVRICRDSGKSMDGFLSLKDHEYLLTRLGAVVYGGIAPTRPGPVYSHLTYLLVGS